MNFKFQYNVLLLGWDVDFKLSKFCQNCGYENADNYLYCRQCGNKLPETPTGPPPRQAAPPPDMIYCPQCSRQNPRSATVCTNCGYQLAAPDYVPKPDRGFRWYYCFTYPLYFLFDFLMFCCCCCTYDRRRRTTYGACDASSCDLSGCDCTGCDCNGNGCDCGDCDCGDCDLGGCDCDCS